MTEFQKRLAFSLVAAPGAVAIVWFGGAALAVLLAVAAALAAFEFGHLGRDAGSRPLQEHGVVLAALVPLCVHAARLGLWAPPVSVLMLLSVGDGLIKFRPPGAATPAASKTWA